MRFLEQAYAMKSFVSEIKTGKPDPSRCYNRYPLAAEDLERRKDLADHICYTGYKCLFLSGSMVALINFACRRIYSMPVFLFLSVTPAAALLQWSIYEYRYFENQMVDEMARNLLKFDARKPT